MARVLVVDDERSLRRTFALFLRDDGHEVETAEDVQERLDAGATLVQGYTGFVYRGPLWARQINRGLVKLRPASGRA